MDGRGPDSTTWTVDGAPEPANGGYPAFGDLRATELRASFDPAAAAGYENGRLTADLTADGAAASLPAGAALLEAPDTSALGGASLVAASEVAANFSTWGTASANANLALEAGDVDLAGAREGDVPSASALGSLSLSAGGAYTHPDARGVRLLACSGRGGYLVAADIAGASSKTLDATLPVEAGPSFGLAPDGRLHEGADGARAASPSAVSSNNGAPIAGEIASVAPLAKGTPLSGGGEVTEVLAPVSLAARLAANDLPITAEGQVRLLVEKADGQGAAGLTPLAEDVAYDEKLLSVPLAFALPGGSSARWSWRMDYTGSHMGGEGAFGYRVGYRLSLPEQDVAAPALSRAGGE